MLAQEKEDIRHARVNSLVGLKIVALAMIFIWHFGFFTAPDLGSRMCEFFFACSGVLEAVRHFGNYEYTLEESFENFVRKFKKMYPVYLVTFVLALLLGQLGASAWSAAKYKLVAVFSLFMLQVWDARTMFAFNGASWFLCDLLICYAFTPLMSYVVERTKRKVQGSSRGTLVLLVLCVLLRLAIDIAAGHAALTISTHTFPPVRLLDYFIAYVCGCLALDWNERVGDCVSMGGKALQTLVEVVAILLYAAQVLFTTGLVVNRTFGMLCSVVVVLVFVFCRGGMSSFFSASPFLHLSKIELEFYMVHQLCIYFCYFAFPNHSHLFIVASSLALAFAMSYVVKIAERMIFRLLPKIA